MKEIIWTTVHKGHIAFKINSAKIKNIEDNTPSIDQRNKGTKKVLFLIDFIAKKDKKKDQNIPSKAAGTLKISEKELELT